MPSPPRGATYSCQGVERRLVRVGEGVQIRLGGRDARMAHPFLDDLQIGAAMQEPGGVTVTQVVHAYAETEVRRVLRGLPHVLTEPAAWDVTIGVDSSRHARAVLARRSPLGAVDGVGVLAVPAAALPHGVAG